MQAGDLAGATIVFDLDGTLVDTAPDLVRALNQTLDLEGLPPARLEVVRGLVGRGARVLIERASTLAGAGFSEQRLDQLTLAFIDFYRADIAAESRPFPGALEAMDELSQAGARLSVCTNKRTDLSVQLLDALNLSARFSAIVGADAVAQRKPHPDHFRAAVTRAGGLVERALMVGDTLTDLSTARAAGAPAAIVAFGYGGAEEGQGADALISHFSELPAACQRLLATA
ncbi:MAG: phosphoglycolate phosphatase [Hyphomonadaceae bacterium]|nr:phosphoglycolate phosphatase [Hyphomonadaceae bacterium]